MFAFIINMKNKILIIVLSILNCTASYSQSPNILLIIADDLGVDAFNGYNIGSLKPTTPNLDSIRNMDLPFPMHGHLPFVLQLGLE